ncbi:serine hydrolase [Pigmentiphaga aceris]|uniref:Serine hydrolase n=1 Tax=Pigmentiphaga aceris TaxID=1940612 RepID=A0A5C0AVG0_9BURK|nr:serine hydrolase [Pigmentiphaga aceris]QEI04651.1 serine hydrolase [Pigmentiphaga aceris]
MPSFAATPTWPTRLQASLEMLDERVHADVGVYVHDLTTGIAVAHRAHESWYLASMVKVPVALAVMQAVDRGEISLDTRMTLRAADYVDGAGNTNSMAPGTALSVRHLIEQMIIYSDNTASDMLIELVGLDAVNALVQTVIPGGMRPITTLADVRREIYSHLVPGANRLAGMDFVKIRRQPSDADRVRALQGIVGTPTANMPEATLEDAYAAYYATRVNSGPLDAYGALLAQLAQGRVLTPASTDYLLKTMRRVKTGDRRLKAGFPPATLFAHKTGTQRARFCDAGIVDIPSATVPRQAVIVACVSGDASLTRSEQALKEVGTVIRQSGFFSE